MKPTDELIVIETPMPLGGSHLRVDTAKWLDQRGWTRMTTKEGKEILVDDKGSVDAFVVDTVEDTEKDLEIEFGHYL